MARTATWCTATEISRYAEIPTKGAGNKTSFFANATPALTTCYEGLYVLTKERYPARSSPLRIASFASYLVSLTHLVYRMR
jgi:hypothetical protein